MNKHTLLIGFLLACLMLTRSSEVAAHGDCPNHPTPPAGATNPPSETATVPTTQSTANMDSASMMRTNDFMVSPSDLDANGRLTVEAEMQVYRQALKESYREDAKFFREYQDHLDRQISAELNAAQALKLNETTGEYLPPPGPQKVKAAVDKLNRGSSTTAPPNDDEWNFLPDFIPGVSVYENMPTAPAAPEAVPSPQRGQAPAGGKSDGSDSTEKDDSDPDLIVL